MGNRSLTTQEVVGHSVLINDQSVLLERDMLIGDRLILMS